MDIWQGICVCEPQGSQRLVNGEREIMSMTDSDFVIRLHRTFKDTQHVYFLLEAALGGSLIQAGLRCVTLCGACVLRSSRTTLRFLFKTHLVAAGRHCKQHPTTFILVKNTRLAKWA